MKRQGKSYVMMLALVCAALWGSAYPCVKLSYEAFGLNSRIMPRILLAGIRFSMAGALLLLYVRFVRRESLAIHGKRAYLTVLALSVLQTMIQYSLYYIGMAHTSAAKGAVLNQSSSFFLVLLAPLFFKEDTLKPRKIIGVLLGLAGIAVSGLQEGFGGEASFIGEGFMVISALAAAFGYLVSKKARGCGVSPLVLTGWQQLTGGGILLTVALISGATLNQCSGEGLGLLLYLTLVASCTYPIWMELLQNNEVAKVSVFKFMVPIFGTVFSALLLAEPVLNATNLTALALVAFGIIVVNV